MLFFGLAVAALLSSFTLAVNVRTAERKLQSAVKWRYNMLSGLGADEQFLWIYEWGPYDITLETNAILTGDQVQMTLLAVDEFSITLAKKTDGNYRVAQLQKSTTNTGTEEQRKGQQRIIDIVGRADDVQFNDNFNGLTFKQAKSSLHFDKIPLVRPIVGQEWDGNAAVDDRFKHQALPIIPSTFLKDNRHQELYGGGEKFPMVVFITPTSTSSVVVSLKALNTHNYEFAYNEADGWVKSIKKGPATNMASLSPAQNAAESKIVQIVANTQQIAFEKDGVVQFINGSDRISFGEPSRRKLQESNIYELVSSSYQVQNQRPPLFEGMEVVVPMVVTRPSQTQSTVSFSLINRYSYTINHDASGWVSSLSGGSTTFMSGEKYLLDAENRLVSIISRTQQLSYAPSNTIQFINEYGATRVAFLKTSTTTNAPDVVPSSSQWVYNMHSYRVMGEYDWMYEWGPYDLLLNFVSGPGFTFGGNTPGGTVSKGFLRGEVDVYSFTMSSTRSTEGAMMISDMTRVSRVPNAAENRVITEERIMRVFREAYWFTASPTNVTIKSKYLGESQISYDLAGSMGRRLQSTGDEDSHSGRYHHNGEYSLSGAASSLNPFNVQLEIDILETTKGKLEILSKVGNTKGYFVDYDIHSFVVTRAEAGMSTRMASPPNEAEVERKINDMILGAQNIIFDGKNVAFVKDYGTSRLGIVRVAPGCTLNPLTSGKYDIIPSTFFYRGQYVPLDVAGLNIQVITELKNEGRVEVTLVVVNTIKYNIHYQVNDGWVEHVERLHETKLIGTPQQMDTEAKLKEIIGATNQLGFEDDGTLQFITNDDGHSRISFQGSHAKKRLLQTIATGSYTLVPETYLENGQFTHLYLNPSKLMISLATTSSNEGDMTVTMSGGVNTMSWHISYNPLDGWVNSSNPGFSTRMAGTPEEMETETKLASLLTDVQQLAFENDGSLQFITNKNGMHNRVLFKGTHAYHRILAGEYVIAAESYFTNGKLETFNSYGLPFTVRTFKEKGVYYVNLIALNTIQWQINYNENDGWVESALVVSETRLTGTPDQVSSENKIRAIIDNVSQLAFENDGTLQFISNSQGRISFRGAHLSRRRLQSTSSSGKYTLLGQTYTSNGSLAPLDESAINHAITLETTAVSEGTLNVVLYALNTVRWKVSYNPADGWVNSVESSGITRMTGTPRAMEVERKLVAIVNDAEQLAFESDGTLQFITNKNGHSRVSFKGQHATTSVKSYNLVHSSYYVNGALSSLPSARPVTLETRKPSPGVLDVSMRVINGINWKIAYNENDGWVSSVSPSFSTYMAGSQEDMELEFKLKAMIDNVSQLAFENDGTLQFITFINGQPMNRVSFKGNHHSSRLLRAVEPGHYSLVPQTYFTNNQFETLFVDRGIQLTLTKLSPDRVRASLQAVSQANWDISYNTADGWVSSVEKRFETLVSGPPEAMETEQKLRRIIDNCNQLAFENDGTLQLISNYNGHSRVSFKGYHPSRRLSEGDSNISLNAASGLALANGEYSIVAASYFENGAFAQLFVSEEKPVKMTIDYVSTDADDIIVKKNVRITVVNNLGWTVDHQVADGWVTKVSAGFSTLMMGSEAEMKTEQRLSFIMNNLNQISYEGGDIVQFITNAGGHCRVSFARVGALTRKLNQMTRKSYVLAPNTYMKNGVMEYLPVDRTITVETKSSHPGQLVVSYSGLNQANWNINYNVADGWVTSRQRTFESQVYGPQDAVNSDNKIRFVIDNVEQLAFENDGTLQFITNVEGHSRVSFRSSSLRRLQSATSSHLEVVPESYMMNGVVESLYSSYPYPIELVLIERNHGSIVFELRAINTNRYRIQLSELDSTVTVVQEISSTKLAGDLSAENRVINMIKNSYTMEIRSDDWIFTSNQGRNQVVFRAKAYPTPTPTPPTPTPPTPSGSYKNVNPSSYMKDGVMSQLYAGSTFPIIARISEVGQGLLEVNLNTPTNPTYQLTYQVSDGWVLNRQLVVSNVTPQGSWDVLETEGRIMNILQNCNQIVFEWDGKIQFVYGNGTNRIQFI